MVQLKSKIYLSLIISFILLLFSLLYSLQNINKNTKIIQNIEYQYISLSSKIAELNYKIEQKQSNTLQAVLLKQTPPQNHDIFSSLINEISTLSHSDEKLDKHFAQKIIIIKKRLVAYKSVEQSIMEALNSKYPEDLEDALIGYNLVTESFLIDAKELTSKMQLVLNGRVNELKLSNKITQTTLAISFFVSIFLIILSIRKLNNLQDNLNIELEKSIASQEKQKHLQEQLLKYNENLEDEITKKTNELYQKVYTHFLSGLPNRNKLLEDTAIYEFSQMALLNIDNFQKFNDVYGEEMGNVALQETANFLSEFIPTEEAHLYHISGDEFAVVVKESSNVDENRFIQEINDFLRFYQKNIFEIDSKKQSFTMSAGIAFSGGKKILAYADMALKDAKMRNIQLSVFNDDDNLEKIHKEDLECKNKLLNAFENDGIISYFQPISPIQDDSLEVKYESLVRIKDGSTIIPPHTFLDVAKQNKVYYKITKSIFRNTLDVVEKYKIPCTINISVLDIENTRTLEGVYKMLDDFNYNYLLTVELLETEEFSDYDIVYKFCSKIRSYGIKIALDDFGAGYSNFSHILNLPIDYIKIDASLVSNIDRDRQSQIMVETIVGLAKKLNVKTIAEFVSSEEILATVKSLGVDYAQGYYVGKPEAIEHYIPYI